MIEIAKDEILLMLDGNVFFFNEEGKYTSLTAKEAKKKNFKNLFLIEIHGLLVMKGQIYSLMKTVK